MIYELELLEDPIASAKAACRSPIAKLHVAAVEFAVQNMKRATDPPTAEQWRRFLREVNETLAEARKADHEWAEQILDDLDERARQRDEAHAEFDAIAPTEGRRLQ